MVPKGAQCAHTFFRRLFLHEKRGLEVQNSLTFFNSLLTSRKSKLFFWFFSVFWGNLEGVGTNRVNPICIGVEKIRLVVEGGYLPHPF